MAQRFPGIHKPERDITFSMCVPLALPDRVIGALNVSRSSGRAPFTAADAASVTVFAAHIAIAIERMREQEEMRRILAQHEDQLRQAQKMDALGRLAGGVAHDFNNLLTVIVAHSSLLVRSLRAGDPIRQRLDKISDAAGRCVGLTRQLLTFSRKEALEHRLLDLNACVSRTGELLRRLIGEDIQLISDLSPDVGRVYGDDIQLQQVLMNLALNAREAMPGGGRITLQTKNIDIDATVAGHHLGSQPGPHVLLSVMDTGCGMDEETCARLFEPFFTTKPGGTGLGLSTVYGLVRQGGGFITVESRPGHGTAFRIYFPRAGMEAQGPGGEVVASPVGEDSSAYSLLGTTILLVEDEDEVRHLTHHILKSHGCRVLEARWPAEAAMVAESHPGAIDLVLSDVVMPEQSGGQLAQWMSVIRPDLPILFMSGYPDDEIVRRGVQTHAASLLHKPFTPEALLASVSACLAARGNAQETSSTRRA